MLFYFNFQKKVVEPRKPFLFNDEETLLLFDWYEIDSTESIIASTTISSLTSNGKSGTIINSVNSYQSDGSIFFGYNGYLLVKIFN